MKKGYWILRVDVIDFEIFKVYAEAAAVALGKYGGKFLARAGQTLCVEGEARERNTVIEFPTYQDALDCWHSAEYQDAIAIRRDISTVDLVVIEGY